MDLTLTTPGVRAYNQESDRWFIDVETPEALEPLFVELTALGYERFDDAREDEFYLERLGSAAAIEADRVKRKTYLWVGHLKEYHFGLCKSCKQVISRSGILISGHQCEKCGKITHVEYPHGSTVRFRFTNFRQAHQTEKHNQEHYCGGRLQSKVQYWDFEQSELYLDWNSLFECPQEGDNYDLMVKDGVFTVNGYLADCYYTFTDQAGAQRESWSKVTLPRSREPWSGKLCLKVTFSASSSRHPRSMNSINIESMRSSPYFNFSEVRVWDGVIYGGDVFAPLYRDTPDSPFPLPTLIHLRETWRFT